MGNAARLASRRRERGFTLVELMVTLIVAAILIGVAIPSFDGVINANRLVSQGNELIAALQSARGEAVKRNTRVIVCRSVNLVRCANTAANWTGWVVGVDANRDGQIDTGGVLQVGRVTSPVQVFSSPFVRATGVVFRPDGYAYRTVNNTLLVGSIGVCLPTTRPQENMRAVTIAAGGSRITTKSLNTAGVCAAPSNTP
jgi:type IV fimbrial biogenesis protein FimT